MVKQESKKILQKATRKSSRTIASDDTEISALFGITMDSANVPANPASTTHQRKKKAIARIKKSIRVGEKKRSGADKKNSIKKSSARKRKSR